MDAPGLDPREEDEPERNLHLRTPPPPKKSLEEFLAEFEARLRDHPTQPATSAGEALEARAEGTHRHPIESQPERPPRLPRRPGIGPIRGIARRPSPVPPAAAGTAPAGEEAATAEAAATTPAPAGATTAEPADATTPRAADAPIPGAAEPDPEASTEAARHRRNRRHKHRRR
jgi:hypothetical protein